MLKIAAALEALGLLYTLSGGLSEIAYAGHLGGIAAGFLAARAIKSGKLAFLDKLSFKLPRRKSEKYTKSASEYSYRVNISNPKDLKNEVDRILYLDADVICINPLNELYEHDIEDKYIVACTHTKRTLTTINAIRLGLNFDSEVPYINTGVMLMNIESLRKDFNSSSIFALIEKRGGAFILPDQDIVMALYGERIALVDSIRYNLSDRMMLLANQTIFACRIGRFGLPTIL